MIGLARLCNRWGESSVVVELFIDGRSLAGKLGPLLFLGLIEQTADQSIVKIDGSIGELSLPVQQKRRENGVTLLGRKAPEVTQAVTPATSRQLLEPNGGNRRGQSLRQTAIPHPIDPLQQVGDARRGAGAGHAPHPAEQTALRRP